MKYFSIEELCHSDVANRLKMDNTPNAEQKHRLEVLIEELLDPLREAWGSAIKVNSGYRTARLNKILGGSFTSAHVLGYAADIVPVNGKIAEFKAFTKDWLKDKKYDQYIDERSSDAEWVHIGIKNTNGLQRKQNLKYRNSKYYPI